jgi:hypothetical protein
MHDQTNIMTVAFCYAFRFFVAARLPSLYMISVIIVDKWLMLDLVKRLHILGLFV